MQYLDMNLWRNKLIFFYSSGVYLDKVLSMIFGQLEWFNPWHMIPPPTVACKTYFYSRHSAAVKRCISQQTDRVYLLGYV